MAYKRNVEIFEEAYEKKGAKSVVSYVARDGRKRYIAGSKSPDGGGTPMPSGGMEEVTWQELKDKRYAGKLTPGSLYRITDYQCTTTQENTRSAGHQFDIVLLALSENKLAEEGWAMMHDNIYDVTFDDGVTKKCYIYPFLSDGYPAYNIVDIETLLAYSEATEGDISINENNKTASSNTIDSTQLEEGDVLYNYFQNSNLSAWKVWYCLDNDKSRFAWADDSVDEGTPAKIQTVGSRGYTFSTDATFIRDEQYDEIEERSGKTFYAWVKDDDNSTIAYTISNPPLVGKEHYLYIKLSRNFVQANGNTVDGYTPPTQGTGLSNGRGVIYRLIDEWNNDVGYDFKNIQFLVKIDMETGYYDEEGDDTYVYSLNAWIDAVIMDASIIGNTLQNDVGIIDMVANNVIKTMPPVYTDAKGYYLPFNVVLTSNKDGEGYYGANDINFDNNSNHNIVTSPCSAMHFDGLCSENVIPSSAYATFINCANLTSGNSYLGLYLNNKKVLTES